MAFLVSACKGTKKSEKRKVKSEELFFPLCYFVFRGVYPVVLIDPAPDGGAGEVVWNVRHTINAQGRTETFYNVIPSYALFHVTWRLNKKAKKE